MPNIFSCHNLSILYLLINYCGNKLLLILPEEVSVFILEDLLEGGPGATLGLLAVLLLDSLGERVHVPEDEVKLGVAPALVWPEHNGVGCLNSYETPVYLSERP
jgi:hypothetical protein